MIPEATKQCGFTLAHYRYCLEQGQQLGYRFITMSEYIKGTVNDKAIIVMRHDEDLSLEAAARLAEIESALGIRATYFLRLHAQNYNLLAWPNLQILARLQKQGHEIGLHGEAHALGASAKEPGRLLELERQLLSHLIGEEVRGLSLHEPTRMGGMGQDPPPGFDYEAYSDKFSELKYISDSSAHWREGCMCGHLGKVDRLYILTHGFWWYESSPVENY